MIVFLLQWDEIIQRQEIVLNETFRCKIKYCPMVTPKDDMLDRKSPKNERQ